MAEHAPTRFSADDDDRVRGYVAEIPDKLLAGDIEAELSALADNLRATWQVIDDLEEECARLRAIDSAPTTALQIAAIKSFDPHGFFVYVLYGHNDEVLYVGQSSNVFGRVGDHVGHPSKRARIARVKVTRCGSRAHMDRVEKDLIGYFSPPWNTTYVRRAV